MTDLAAYPQGGATLAPTANLGFTTLDAPAIGGPAAVDLERWAHQADAAGRIARIYTESGMVPLALKKKGQNSYKTLDEIFNDARAIILAGSEIGFSPSQALQNIFPVHGQPSMYARAMRALLQSAGHKIVRVSVSGSHATYKAQRAGSTDWIEYTWTTERADKAGYTKNAKYSQDPVAMLSAKAIAEACRDTAPEVLIGLPYSKEELELEDLGEAEAAAPAAPAPEKKKITRRKSPAAPTPAVPAAVMDAPADEEVLEVDEETGEIIDDVDWFSRMEPIAEDRKALQALWREAKAAGADDAILESIAAAGTTAKEAA